ncbi:MAG: hypothetical protein J3K34DRAFT_498341 [Monoraphidium minutum]|nr:MAG: hypothetical protein J3K34DRAFT_498341 [Monoraphidium minutum]
MLPASGAAAPPPQQLSEPEQQQLLAALRQPLFLQSPLQALLEHLVTRLGAATAASTDAQRRMGALERGAATQGELLERVRDLEARMAAPAAAASPFAVTQLAGRVGALEKAAARLEEDIRVLKFQAAEVRRIKAAPGRRRTGACLCVRPRVRVRRAWVADRRVLERRLAGVEAQLAGVSNLAGQLMALDQVVGELGLEAPRGVAGQDTVGFESTAGGGPSAGPAVAAPAASSERWGLQEPPPLNPQQQQANPRNQAAAAAAGAAAEARGDWPGAAAALHGSGAPSTAWPPSPGSEAPARGDLGAAVSSAQMQPAARDVGGSGGGGAVTYMCQSAGAGAGTGAGGGAGGGGAQPSKIKQELNELSAQLGVTRAEGRAAAALAQQLQQQVASLSEALAEAEDRQSTSAASLQDASQTLADTLAKQVSALRREMARPPEVSLAEFSKLQSAAAKAADDARAAARGVQEVQVRGGLEGTSAFPRDLTHHCSSIMPQHQC